jgi:hypothetical protein
LIETELGVPKLNVGIIWGSRAEFGVGGEVDDSVFLLQSLGLQVYYGEVLVEKGLTGPLSGDRAEF